MVHATPRWHYATAEPIQAHPVGCTLFRNHKQSNGYAIPKHGRDVRRREEIRSDISRISPINLRLRNAAKIRLSSASQFSSLRWVAVQSKPEVAGNLAWKQLFNSGGSSSTENDGKQAATWNYVRCWSEFPQRSDNARNIANVAFTANAIVIAPLLLRAHFLTGKSGRLIN